ncbi:MAG: thioredoxin [Candidatus Aenigmarchaeota archaeon]|nr:thioredoxin [Candidatus Aenigmarchaeota archaeon]
MHAVRKARCRGYETQGLRVGAEMTAVVAELSDSNFNDFVAKHKVALVDFYADWCGPCQAMKPVIDELAGEMKGKVSFAKANMDKAGATANKYGIMSIPTLLIFKNGKMMDRLVGAFPKDMIKQRLAKMVE